MLDRLERAKHYTSICNSAPSEVLALIALRAGEQILRRNRAIVAENVEVFTAFFDRLSRTCSTGNHRRAAAWRSRGT